MKHLILIFLAVLIERATSAVFTELPNFKGKECGTNEEYRTCGPKCPHTCDTLKDTICCEVRCVPGCFCKDGYMLLSKNGPNKCVPIETCPRPGVLKFEERSIVVMEGDGVIRIVVIRINGSYGEATVRWRIIFRTGMSFPDYAGRSGRLVFPDGVVRQVIEIPIVDNNVRGPDISFRIELYEASKKVEIFRNEAYSMLTIKDDDMRPGFLEFEFANYVAQESEPRRMVCVKRFEGTDGELRVKYKTVSGTAIAGSDFVPMAGELIFMEGVDIQHIMIPIINDDIRELDKTFEVELFDPTPGNNVINFRGLGPKIRTVVKIIDDDMKPGFFELVKTNYVVSENIGTLKIEVVRVYGTDGQIRVRYKTIVKSGLEKLGFTPTEGELVFEERETKKFIEIQIVDNNIREPTKYFEVQLFDPSPGIGVINFRNLGFQQSVTVTIMDDDMTPGYFELEKPNYVVPESIGILKVGVLRLGGTDGQIRVRYQTTVKTALVNTDFFPVKGELVFEEGESKKYIEIQIIDDDIRESDKTFEVKLFDPSPGVGVINFRGMGSTLTSLVTINDDDMKPGYLEFEFPTYTVLENVPKRMVCVKRYGGTDGELRVKYKTVSITAVEGKDFVSMTNELVFKEGVDIHHIMIPIINNDIREIDRTFAVELFDPTPGNGVINFRGLGPKIRTVVKIIDDDMNPGIFELEQATYTVSENVGILKVGVLRVGGMDGQIRIKYKTVQKTALPSVDFLPVMGELIFEEGETKKFIEIQIINNDIRDPTKTFEIQLFEASAGAGVLNFRGRGSGSQLTSVINITDDDLMPGYLEMEKATMTISENVGTVLVTVKRVGGTDGQIRVKYRIVGNTALSSIDFIAIPGELIFNDGEIIKTIPITIVNDNIRELTKSFKVELYESTVFPSMPNFRSRATVIITQIIIIDDDNKPGVLVMEKESINVSEDVGAVQIAIVRTGGSDGTLVVRYRTVDGTAVSGTDYTLTQGELTFSHGEVRKICTIPIINDNIKEPMKTFQVELFDPLSRSLGSTRRTVITIIDDDKMVGFFEFSQSSITIQEIQPKLTLTVVRRGGMDGTVTLQWRTIDRTTIAGQDFKPTQGSITFLEGEAKKTISIDIIHDDIKENDEQFLVGLFNPSDGGTLGTINTVIVTIQDNAPIAVVPKVESIEIFFVRTIVRVKKSAGKVRLHIRRTGELTPLTVFLRTRDGTAKGRVDYRRTRGEISFLENEIELTVELRLVENNQPEEDRRFTVEISRPSKGSIIPTGSVATVIIENDRPKIEGRSYEASAGLSGDFKGQTWSVSGSYEARGGLPSPLPSPSPETPKVHHQITTKVEGRLISHSEFIPQEPPQGTGQGQRPNCPVGMTFKLCAPTCPKTCQTMTATEHCQNKCINACFCPDGMVIDNLESLKCIFPKDCTELEPRTLGKLGAAAGIGSLLGGLGLGGFFGGAG